MPKGSPLILSIVGKSDSGKTTLILKLLPELKKKGYKVAVAKHCPGGFDLDLPGKDSWKFTQAGAEATFLSSNQEVAVLRPQDNKAALKEKLENYFSDFDLVLTEGYHNESGIKKIQLIRRTIGQMDLAKDEIVAYLSDMPLNSDKPVYALDDISGILSFIERFKVQQVKE